MSAALSWLGLRLKQAWIWLALGLLIVCLVLFGLWKHARRLAAEAVAESRRMEAERNAARRSAERARTEREAREAARAHADGQHKKVRDLLEKKQREADAERARVAAAGDDVHALAAESNRRRRQREQHER